MKIEENKSYNLSIPSYSDIKVHIDYILENKKDDRKSRTLIVLRYWVNTKNAWVYQTFEYFELAIYNDWNYNKLDKLNNIIKTYQ